MIVDKIKNLYLFCDDLKTIKIQYKIEQIIYYKYYQFYIFFSSFYPTFIRF